MDLAKVLGLVSSVIGIGNFIFLVFSKIIENRKTRIIVASLICIVLFGIAVFLWLWNPEPLSLRITSLRDGEHVQMYHQIEGYTSRPLNEDEHLFIMVSYGDTWWPQNGEMTVAYSEAAGRDEFNTNARIGNEADLGRFFNIYVIIVDSSVRQYFQNWKTQNDTTHKWDGLLILDTKSKGNVEFKDTISVIRE
jgi:hypothetical protein